MSYYKQNEMCIFEEKKRHLFFDLYVCCDENKILSASTTLSSTHTHTARGRATSFLSYFPALSFHSVRAPDTHTHTHKWHMVKTNDISPKEKICFNFGFVDHFIRLH